MARYVHVEWGISGARACAASADVIVIVDVLSFSTAVEVAVSRGASVLPFGVRDYGAARRFAEQQQALLAVSRSRMSESEPYSLSPPSLLNLPSGTRLVLPSPNGSTITVEAARGQRWVIAGCLRNSIAVARAAAQLGDRLVVI